MYLPRSIPTDRLEVLINNFDTHGLTADSCALFEQIAAKFVSDDACIEDLLALILNLNVGKNHHSQEYRVRCILEYVIESPDDWHQVDSEMTVYRRVASIMDYLFRSTGIKLVNGESISQCTKSARQGWHTNLRQLFSRH
ncbi:hypothetical protein BDB00DRAFT_115501 [Zychaea mexicana]|uniref:uncharacterized protein n=1 Tax=Zychaea mexicana TaxID=64656 RepID=UPI0022FEB9E9|nr:uncharacterized protein BDB00DRAFT_115501 [Zychaea mexicana]KAI9484685.1 hypothetical protein BDB00DRAFT_115501 [Zychaea mexicana]